MCGRSFRTRSCGRCSWTMTPAHQAHNDSNRNPGGSPPTLLKKKRPCRVSVNIIGGLNEFLKTSPSMPENVQKLQAEAGIKLVLTNLDRRRRNPVRFAPTHLCTSLLLFLPQDDPENLGCFVQYRVAFYVAGFPPPSPPPLSHRRRFSS